LIDPEVAMVMQHYAPRFVLIESFERRWKALGLDDDDLRSLELAIQAGPDRHPVIRETGGLRKIRFAAPGAGRGKSGSYRVGYAHYPSPVLLLLLLVWAKNEKDELSKAECDAIADALTRFESLIRTGAIR
jgi:hypothetical protein